MSSSFDPIKHLISKVNSAFKRTVDFLIQAYFCAVNDYARKADQAKATEIQNYAVFKDNLASIWKIAYPIRCYICFLKHFRVIVSYF